MTGTHGSAPLLLLEHATAGYGKKKIIEDVSIDVHPGEVVALVGESGSGKTTVARAAIGLIPVSEGKIYFDGHLLRGQSRPSGVRQAMQMVFQDPRSALNPRQSIFRTVTEGWRAHPEARPAGSARAAAVSLLEQVGLDGAMLDRRPGQLSGGQCQRVAIARALALNPRLLVCDEAVSALDVSVQAQILHLLDKLRKEHNLALLFITHDLGVVRQIAERVAVMQHGRIVELGDTESVYTHPQDPYTQELLAAALDVAEDEPEMTRQR